MGLVSDFLDAIEYLIQKYQKECTTIYSGTVQSVSDKSCSMNVNGNVYNNIAYYGIAPIVGNSYRVFVPFNNMSLAFIIVSSTTTSGSSDVSSVNGKTGDVVLTANDVGALPADTVIPTVNNATLTIRRNSVDIGSFTANSANDVNIDINVPTDKSDIGLGNVDNVKQYSVTNPPPYPVTSVNGQTGDVTIEAGGNVDSVNGKTGVVVLTPNDIGINYKLTKNEDNSLNLVWSE